MTGAAKPYLGDTVERHGRSPRLLGEGICLGLTIHQVEDEIGDPWE